MKTGKLLKTGISLCLLFTLFQFPVHAAGQSITVTKVEPTLFVKEAADSTADHPKYQNDVVVKLNNTGEAFDAWAKIYVANDAPYIVKVDKKIAKGNNEITIPVTDTRDKLKKATDKTTLKVEIFNSETCSGSPLGSYETNEWKRTRHWEVYFSQTMHTDIGFTHYQEDLRTAIAGFLDDAQKYVDNSNARPTDVQKYKYMVESGWDIGDSFMKKRNAEQIEQLTDLIKEQVNMSITAGMFNYTTETFNTEELARATYYTNRYLVDALGIEASELQNMFDNPSFSKSYVDTAVGAGIKYGFHSMNQAHSPYHKKRQYDIFYMQGNNPKNKMLVYNGYKYSVDFGFGSNVTSANSQVLNVLTGLQNRPEERGTGLNPYPYDKFCFAIVPYGDNAGPRETDIQVANQLNKQWQDAGYVYPRIKVEFQDTFMKDVEKEFGPEGENIIPTESGTEENWWNDGWGTTAYEGGINKEAGNLLSAAEKAASFAALQGKEDYPINELNEAVNRNLTYDEHTWGASGGNAGNSTYHNQFEWKRSNAFATKSLSEKVLEESLQSLSKQVHTTEENSIYVYNSLNWNRNDVVEISDTSNLPTNFRLYDGAKEIPYTMTQDGVLQFVAPDVPALGYKVFTVQKVDASTKVSDETVINGNIIENSYYKVTFADDGTISSIIDKSNGNREIVDNSADVKFNQYQYYDDFGVPGGDYGTSIIDKPDRWKHYQPSANAAKLLLKENAIGKTAKLDTSTFRAGSIVQTVTLYDDIPRIDISNEVVKEALPNLNTKEEAYYTFPFNAGGNYKIQYDLPSGNTGEGEQVYGTATDWYTANKWVNVKDGNYNMALAIPNTTLLMFGERRLGEWSFDYKSQQPYIYSWVMNNFWNTNFQRDQPGYVNFKYSISTNQDAKYEKTSKFGWEISNPLQATIIKEKQESAGGGASGTYLTIDQANVQLSTMKYAEANGDGMIVRFHEAMGKDTTVNVTLPYANIASITSTDIIENDIKEVSKSNSFSFTIPAYDFATFRVKFNDTTNQVTAGNAITDSKGTKVSWNQVDGAQYYEVFRSYDENEVGGYLGSTTELNFYDTQVVSGLSKPYYYNIRAVGSGVKSQFSGAIKQANGTVLDTSNPEKPILDAQKRSTSQIDLWWTPVEDDINVVRYDVYRDGAKIGSTKDAYVISYRDKTVTKNMDYTYTVKAIDANGKETASEEIIVSTKEVDKPTLDGLSLSNGVLNNKFEAMSTVYDIRFGSRLNGVKDFTITPVSNDPDVIITVNGVEVKSGNPSQALAVSEDSEYIIKVTKGDEFRVYTLYPVKELPLINPSSATAGSEYNAAKGAIHTIDNSGMSGTKALTDVHDADGSANTMWHTGANPGANAWIQYDLGSVYKLDELYIWNMNQGTNNGKNPENPERALKNVKIEYSQTGAPGSWVELQPEDGMVFSDSVEGYPFQLAPTKGEPNMPASNLNDGKNTPVRFDGREARYVKISAHPEKGKGNWSTGRNGSQYFGLSEVRFTALIDRDIYKDALQELVDECTLIIGDQEIYLERNWAAFEAKLTEAQALLVNDQATQNEIDEMEVQLSAAKENLVKKPTIKEPIIPALSATAGSTYSVDRQNPMNVINNAGLSENSLQATHDNNSSALTMWHTLNDPQANAWIQVDLGEVYELDEMWIWNMNQESNMTRGLKNVKIEYSEDGAIWNELLPEEGLVFSDPMVEGYPFQFTKASGNETITATNLNDGKETPVRFHGVKAKYVKITAAPTPGEGSWGDVYYGLSELKFTQLFQIDKASLHDLIEEHKDKEDIGYSEESWNAFEEALANAIAIDEKADATAAEVETAYETLAEAIQNLTLVPVEVNKERLEALYAQYKDYQQNDYSEDSWNAFVTALANAKAVIDNDAATAAQVAAAIHQLESAVAGLDVKQETDKSALQAAFQKYEGLKQGNYTNSSWKVFALARKNAEKVLSNPNATQAQIDNALKQLEEGFHGLVENTSSNPNTPGDPLKPIKPSKPSGNNQSSGGANNNMKTGNNVAGANTGVESDSANMLSLIFLSGVCLAVLKKKQRSENTMN